MEQQTEPKKEIYIKITKDGPYLVYGTPKINEAIILTDENGTCIEYGEGKVFEIKTSSSSPISLCRCGQTKNSPFCDGTHSKIAFNGEETAKFEKVTDNAKIYHGAKCNLIDKEELCALARFCDANGSIWELVYKDDEYSCHEVLKQAHLCPSGRLIITDKEGNIIEEEYPEEISVLEDSGLKISGPIWVKGRIRVESADGASYEVRNRQTLCRCGNSSSKPFCDCTHKHIGFKAKKQS